MADAKRAANLSEGMGIGTVSPHADFNVGQNLLEEAEQQELL